jgi:hypothetical protein
MNEFEEMELQLQRSLARKDAPPGLADRIFARTTRKPSWTASFADARRRPSLVWSLAAVIVTCMAGSAAWHEHEQRVEGERAAENVKLALRITAAKIHIAESRVNPEPRP